MKHFTFSRLFTLALLISLPLWLDSCKKDSDATPASVAGTWKFSTITVNPGLSGITDVLAFLKAFGDTCLSDVAVTFKSDGTITSTSPPSCANSSNGIDELFATGSKWTVNGSKLTINDPVNGNADFDYTLNGNTLQLKFSEQDTDPTTGKPVTYTYTFVLNRQ